jgi:hypothetical protein
MCVMRAADIYIFVIYATAEWRRVRESESAAASCECRTHLRINDIYDLAFHLNARCKSFNAT